MKKLVSICFLSILFSMFSVQAQRDCCFQLSNPHGDTLHNIANLPNGDLPLSHSMNPLVYQNTDIYDLIFANENCLGIDYEKGKVSVELELWCDGENILDGQHTVSDYCTIALQTAYNELHWLGSNMQQGHNDYPGAIVWNPGTYEISNVAYDYFFFKFLVNTNSRIKITWNQVFNDVVLIAHIRERINGTNNEFYWDDNQRLNLGGHQSQPGEILASDTLTNHEIIQYESTIADCEPVTVGKPEFIMDTTGTYIIAYVDMSCGYRIDSVVTYHYTHYVHPTTPTLHDSTFSYCQNVTADPIVLPAEPNADLADHVDQIVAYWSVYGRDFEYMPSFTPVSDTTAGEYEFYVKRHDNVTGCESEIDTFHVTINPMPAGPVVPAEDRVQEYCVGAVATQLAYNGPIDAGMRVLWGNTPDATTSVEAPTPTTDAEGTQYYYLRIQDMNTDNECISNDYDSIIVNVYANPVVSISADFNTLCYGDTAVLSANPTNLTSYQWMMGGSEIPGATDTVYAYINMVADTTTQEFTLYVTEKHPEVTCHATSDIYQILAYPEMGVPTLDSGETTVCGPTEITLKVNNGTHASTSKWYAADKTTVLAENTIRYTATYSKDTTIYVSSLNDFGCETPEDNWLQIDITVNDVPHITLAADNNRPEVCAGQDLIIRSTIEDSTSTSFAYSWTSNPVATLNPDNADTTAFSAATKGNYTVKLVVSDFHGCTDSATIDITVDTLPIIAINTNYTVMDNDFCVGGNGKIEFTTPDYAEYSINNGADWQTEKLFDSLVDATYNLLVKDNNGCVNDPANVEVINFTPAIRTITYTDSANTHCAYPYDGVLIAHVTAEKQGRTEDVPNTYEYTLMQGDSVWGPQTDSVFTTLADGTYRLAVTNTTTNCTDTVDATVTDGKADLTTMDADIKSNTHCSTEFEKWDGQIVVKSLPEGAYKYEITAGPEICPLQVSNVFDSLKHGVYSVRVYDTVTVCDYTKDFTIDSVTAVVELFLSDSANTHCTAPFGGFIYVDSVKPDADYQYKLAEGTYQVEPTFSGLKDSNYTVYAQDVHTACVASKDIEVRFIGVLPTGTISSLDYICFGDTAKVSFIPDGDAKFQNWTYVGPATQPLIDPIKNLQSFDLINFPAGKHTFTAHFIDTVTHCTNSIEKTIRVIGVNINLHVSPSITVCEFDTVKVFCEYFPDDVTDTIKIYNWFHPDFISIPGVEDTIKVVPTFVYNRVSLVATDNHNCRSTKYVDLKVNELPNIKLDGAVDYCQNLPAPLKASYIDITASSDSVITDYSWALIPTVVSDSNRLYIPAVQDTDVVLTIKDNHGCVNDSTISINVIEVPGKPMFIPDHQYFCSSEEVYIDTTKQYAPEIGGTLRWKDLGLGYVNPNIDKKEGHYQAAFFAEENGVSCTRGYADLYVHIPALSRTDVTITYNDETTPVDSIARCFSLTSFDTLHVSVANPAYATATDTLSYSYKLNGVDTTANMILSHIAPATYTDTIMVSSRRVHPDKTVCTWDTTIYVKFTVNPLPTAPIDFPTAHNNVGTPTIFYCEGENPVSYSFTIPQGVKSPAHYSYGTHVNDTIKPDSAFNNIQLILTTDYGCVDSFKYDIVEVQTPVLHITRKSDPSYCQNEVFVDTIRAEFTNFASADTSVFVWSRSAGSIERHKDISWDTLAHTFTDIDTMVVINGSVVYVNGSYGATCSLAQPDTIDINFISAPTAPQLSSSYPTFVDSARATYCPGDVVAITKADFVSSSDSIVIYDAGTVIATIDTAGTYDVVAYSKVAPYCPSDTLSFTLIENRMPQAPTNLFAATMYNDTVYYCANSEASYSFTPQSINDSLSYAEYGTSNFSADQPTTEGFYTIRITDIAALAYPCHFDTTFKIKKVAMPSYKTDVPVVYSGTNYMWADTMICYNDNHFNVTYKQNYKKQHIRLKEVSYKAYRIWNGDTLPGETHNYNFDVTNDTTLTFTFSVTDTVGNVGYGVACPYWHSDSIDITYYDTLKAPVYTGVPMFCDGDSLVISASSFTVDYTGDTLLYSSEVLPHTYYAAGAMKVAAYYREFTACHSDTTTITITKNALPTVSIIPNDPFICKGDTVPLTAVGASTYVWSTGEETTSIKVTDSIQYVVTGTDVNNCSNTDTVKVNFYPGFTVDMMNDTLVCVGESVELNATVTPAGSYVYSWYKDEETSPFANSNPYEVTPTPSAIVEGVPVPTLYKLEVSDVYGCVSVKDSNVVAVTSTDRPQFEFREVNGTESIREMNANIGDQTSFEMYINRNCYTADARVFVDYQIYKDGVPMTDAQLNNTLDAFEGAANSQYVFDLTVGAPALAYLGSRQENHSTASDYFPKSHLFNGTSFPFDWFYLRFLDNRKITVNLGSWKPATEGVYTISYAVIIAGEAAADNGTIFDNHSHTVGGHDSHTVPGFTHKDTIAFDIFTINVGASGANSEIDAPTSITTLDASVDVDMKVYPNPANTDVNVALSGVEGQTVVSVHDMSGKVISSQVVNVEMDGQIINLPVGNYSQGIYFIKVVNGDAMMTKKLIIAR